MAYDEALAARIEYTLSRRKNVVAKKMFGGLAFLHNGNMLVGVWKDSLIARVGVDAREEALLEPHVQEFNVTGRPMKGWVLVAPEGVTQDQELTEWIQRATQFVATLPAK